MPFFPKLDRAIRIPEPIAEISWAMGSGASHFSDLTELVGANPPWLPWLWAEEGSHGGTTPTAIL